MTRAEARSRLTEAQGYAAGRGVGEVVLKNAPDHVVITFARPVEERDAATEHVRSVEGRADEWDDGPLWRGHALHQAFLAGCDWAKEQER